MGLPLTGSGRGGSIYEFERCAFAKRYALSEPEFTEFLKFTELSTTKRIMPFHGEFVGAYYIMGNDK
jgi:hypothetical protein